MHLLGLIYVHFLRPISAIPYTLAHPEDFEYFNNKINLVMANPSDEDLIGDNVCARYYKEYFEQYEPERANAIYRAPQGRIKEFYLPYKVYPDLEHNPPIQVPVEAILGEIYYVRMKKETRDKGSMRSGCHIACQDLRKTMEIVIAAKLSRARHVRVKIVFSFPCAPGMRPRTTRRQSWREPETDEEFDAAHTLLKTLDKKTHWDKLLDYELVVKGRKGEITGCECYRPPEDEMDNFLSNISRKRKSKAYVMARKKLTKPGEEQTGRPDQQPQATGTSSSGSSVGFDDLFTWEELQDTGMDLELFEELDVQDLDTNTDQITCHDYTYPDIQMGMAQAQPGPNQATVNHATTLLQASLFDYTDFDNWLDQTGGASSSNGKHGR